MELTTIAVTILAWIFIVIAPAAEPAYKDALNKSEIKRGVSIFPGIPIMPMLAIMLMYGINYFFNPIGTYILLITHGFFLCYALYEFIYWTNERTNERTNEENYTKKLPV